MVQSIPQTIALGNTEVCVPPLGIGTWAWGDRLFWDYGNRYGAEDIQAAFSAAIAAGVTFFDTAEVYGLGESERLLGQFAQGGDRPIQIATKYFPVPWRIFPQSVGEAINASLERLQVESVALYQVHQPVSFLMSQRSLMDALADAVQAGKIQAIGVSNYSAAQMREAHGYLRDRGIPLAVNQVQYSLLARQIEHNGILDTAHELGVTILAYSPLAQGLLTGKYRRTPEQPAPTSPAGARRIDPRFGERGLGDRQPALDLLCAISDRLNRTPAQVALNWLISQGNVIPIPGAKNAQQAQDNAGAIGWQLSDEDWQALDQAFR